MEVKLTTKTGHVIAAGRLEDKAFEDTTVLKHLGTYYVYSGLKRGVAQFKEIRQPWDVTMVLK